MPTNEKIAAQRKSGIGSFLLVILVLIAAGAGFYYFYWLPSQNKPRASAPPPAPVNVVTVKRGTFPINVEGLGTIQPLNLVAVHSRVDGEIQTINFTEGQMVKKGDLLLTLDARPFQTIHEQAKAKKSQDEANLNNVLLDLGRVEQLSKQNYATQQQLETQRALVASARALQEADEAVIENSQIQIDYTKIRSPIDGRIGFRQVDIGNIIHAGDSQSLATIVQLDPISMVFSLPESRTLEINEAMAVAPLQVAALSSGSKRPISDKGKLTVIANQVDTTSGTIQCKASFDNPDGKLWPGQSVIARLHIGDIGDALVVPDVGVQHGPSGLYAWVVADGVAKMRNLTVTLSAEGKSVIASGLNEGEVVIIDGAYRVTDGAKVDIRQKDAASLSSNEATHS